MDGADNLSIKIDPSVGQTLGQIPMEYIEHWLKLNTAKKKETGFSADIERADRIKRELFKKYEFVKVRNIGEHGEIYYRPRPDGIAPEQTFRRLFPIDADNMVRDAYAALYNKTPASKIKDGVETLKIGVTNEIDHLNDDVIQVSNDLFWDVKDGELVNFPSSGCMRMLFDGEYNLNISQIQSKVVKTFYNKTLYNLNEYDGNVVPNESSGDNSDELMSKDVFSFSTFWTWANGDLEAFNDLLKSVATIFMKNKPKGAFVLIGLTRNGKSTFIKMLHMMLGWKNTSAVKLADLQNHHKNMTLVTTMLNAPDEEDEGRGKDLLLSQSYFKSIASHEPILLDVLYSQEPQRVETNFMSFYPMNHFPEWQGSGATACMKRTLPLFFENDLSKYDKGGVDYAKETFNDMFFAHLLGVVLAIAHYYHNKPIEFSDRMRESQEAVAEEVDNIPLYLDRFMSWFNGYSQKGLVYSDYIEWCKERGLRIRERKVFFQSLSMRNPGSSNYTTPEGEIIRVYKLGDRDGKEFFYPEKQIPELKYKTIGEIILGDENKNNGKSVIASLDYYKEARDNRKVEDGGE